MPEALLAVNRRVNAGGNVVGPLCTPICIERHLTRRTRRGPRLALINRSVPLDRAGTSECAAVGGTPNYIGIGYCWSG